LHEQKVVDYIKNYWPDVDVVSSHQINREWREYERSNTTVLCAYVKPIARNYLDKLSKKLKESNFSGNPYVMQSNGGIDTFEATKIIPLTMIESGPTSGVLGAAELGKLIEEKKRWENGLVTGYTKGSWKDREKDLTDLINKRVVSGGKLWTNP
jgi:N-methylhydantoinase A